MNEIEFMEKMGMRYSSESFQRDMSEFIDYVEVHDYEELYLYVKKNHRTMGAPSISIFWDFAKIKNLHYRKVMQKQSYRICDNCKQAFSNGGSLCQSCGSPDFFVRFGELPDNGIRMQESCHKCRVFGDFVTNKDRTTTFGPDCDEFGGNWTKFPYQHCQGCACKNCCLITRKERHNKEAYAAALHNGEMDFSFLYGPVDTTDIKALTAQAREIVGKTTKKAEFDAESVPEIAENAVSLDENRSSGKNGVTIHNYENNAPVREYEDYEDARTEE